MVELEEGIDAIPPPDSGGGIKKTFPPLPLSEWGGTTFVPPLTFFFWGGNMIFPPLTNIPPPLLSPPIEGGERIFRGGNKLAGGGIKLFPPLAGGGMSENRPKSAFPPLDGGGISKIIKIEGGE